MTTDDSQLALDYRGDSSDDEQEPRWPAIVAALAATAVYLALPPGLSVGPQWLAPLVSVAFIIPTVVSHHHRAHAWNMIFGFATTGALTIFTFWSLGLLTYALLHNTESPKHLLFSAAALWTGNVLIFALWYWRLDAGGPSERDRTRGHCKGAFLFPPMTGDGRAAVDTGDGKQWSPQFIDYLFLSFNTSTAFSPTDVPVLSRWAKVLVMTQASISLAVVIVFVARGINALPT